MKISVALCTYNGEKYLNEQLDSILNQTLKVDEIIVCDDISNDKTLTILEEYSCKNPGLFKIYVNENNLRSVKNFEKATSLCSGEIIFLADQDDIWNKEKVEKMVSLLQNNKQLKVVFTNADLINEKGEFINGVDLWSSIYFNPLKIGIQHLHKYIVLKRNVSTGATMCIKKDFLTKCYPFPIVKSFHHDHWIAFMAASESTIGFINEYLISYRIHANQQVGSKIKNSFFNRIKNQKVDQFLIENKKTYFFRKKGMKYLNNNLSLFENIALLNIQNEKVNNAIALLKSKIKN